METEAHPVNVADMDTAPDLSISTSSSSSDGSPETPATEIFTLWEEGEDQFAPISPENNRYILVTGGLGYIGSHTTLELLKSGYNVIVVDNLSNSYSTVYDRIRELAIRHYTDTKKRMPAFHFHNFDYRDTFALRSLLDTYVTAERDADPWALDDNSFPGNTSATPNPTTSKIVGTIHFAALKAVEESISQPILYYTNNVSGLISLLSTLSAYNIKTFVFSSSATVYGSLADSSALPLPEELCVHQPETYADPCTNSTRLAEPGCTGLTCPYGRTKWMSEAILADLCFADPDWAVVALRYFNPIGCDPSGLLGEMPRGSPSNLMPVVAKVLTGELPVLDVFGVDYRTRDGTAIRDFIHVTDLARGHIRALEKAAVGAVGSGFRAFNLGSGAGHTVKEVVAAMERASGQEIPTRAVGRRCGDVPSCVARTTRAEVELGWKTERTLEVCARDICNFLGLRKRLFGEGEEGVSRCESM